jgi:hypothetical protein
MLVETKYGIRMESRYKYEVVTEIKALLDKLDDLEDYDIVKLVKMELDLSVTRDN